MAQSLAWEALSLHWKRQGNWQDCDSYRASYNDICISIAELATRKGMIKQPPVPPFQPYTQDISEKGKQWIGSIIWSMVAQEVLYVDLSVNSLTGDRNTVFDITEYGRQVLSAGKPIPHDPEGYLLYLKTEIPNVDDVIYYYVKESIMAYNHRLFLSATIAIGCAAEKALLLLLDAYISFLPLRQERDSFIKRTRGRFVKVQFEEFQKSLNGHRNEIDKELTDGIDIVISGVFELLRQNRNSTGHPTGKQMQKEEVFASLQVFVTYCKRIYKLINFFNANQNNEKNNPK